MGAGGHEQFYPCTLPFETRRKVQQQLTRSLADLPQFLYAGNEAQLFIICVVSGTAGALGLPLTLAIAALKFLRRDRQRVGRRQRTKFSVNDCSKHHPRRAPEHDRWPHQLRRLKSGTAMDFDTCSRTYQVLRVWMGTYSSPCSALRSVTCSVIGLTP